MTLRGEESGNPLGQRSPDRLQFVGVARTGHNLTTAPPYHRLTVECGEAQADSGVGSVY